MMPEPGTAWHKNGVTIHVCGLRNGEVYYQRFPVGVESQGWFENLYRAPLDWFVSQCKGATLELPHERTEESNGSQPA